MNALNAWMNKPLCSICRNSRRALVGMGINAVLIGILVAAAVAFERTAMAHHDPYHRILVVGSTTPFLIQYIACDTEEQATSLAHARLEQGMTEAARLYGEYNSTMNGRGQPVCGTMTTFVQPVRIVEVIEQSDGVETIVEVTAIEFQREGAGMSVVGNIVFALMENIRVVEAEDPAVQESDELLDTLKRPVRELTI
jgi:hypothetical protein